MLAASSVIFIFILDISIADKLNVAYQWKILDFAYPTLDERQTAIANKEFIPENNLPLGLEVYENKLFITVPRWKNGVAASLAYIDRNTDPLDSPKLRPYPNWDAHKSYGGVSPEIVSPFRIRADQCGRLWVLDTGVEGILEENTKEHRKSRLLIFDLHNDQLLRAYDIPVDQMKQNSFFANIAVEDNDCEDTFSYLADLSGPGLVVYSFKNNRSWLVKHNFFHIKPTAGDMNVAGISFQWTDGIFGLALSAPESDGFSTLYFHPMTSFDEFSVSTRILRDEILAKNASNYHEFKFLGSRGPKSQSGASFLDKKTGVLFYALVNLNAVACWRTTNPAYTMTSQGRIFMSNVTNVFPNDIKIDNEGNLWVLSDRLPVFMYSTLDYEDVNFRVLTAKVTEAIKGTACASKLVKDPDIMSKITPKLGGVEKVKSKSDGGKASLSVVTMLVTLVALLVR